MSRETHNAQITSTMLGVEDHGIMTFFAHLSWPGAGIGFGGYALDGHDPETKGRRGNRKSIEAIRLICETVGVEKWEDLKGQHCRVEIDGGWGGKAIKIGHIMEDKWFDIVQHFALED